MPTINIILPSFFDNGAICKFFAEQFSMQKNKFYDFIGKISFMGSFPYFLWDDEGLIKQYIPRENIQNELAIQKTNKISLYLNCSNSKLTQEHFQDLYCNTIFDLAKENSLYAVVNNIELAEYLKNKFNYVKLVYLKEKKAEYEDLFDYYKIDFSLNNKNLILNKEPKEKYIVQLNSYCKNDCNCLDKRSIDKLRFEAYPSFNCDNYADSFEETKHTDSFVSIDTMQDLMKKGFTEFIIADNKKDKYELLESCIYYLIKPEFQNEIRLLLLRKGADFLKKTDN